MTGLRQRPMRPWAGPGALQGWCGQVQQRQVQLAQSGGQRRGWPGGGFPVRWRQWAQQLAAPWASWKTSCALALWLPGPAAQHPIVTSFTLLHEHC